MKNVTLIIAILLLNIGAYSQSPNAFSFQAVLRDVNGSIRSNESVSIKVNINNEGKTLFAETHTVTTNDFGLITLNIGSINKKDFETLIWDEQSNHRTLEIIVDGVSMGESELLSVPYALEATHANTSDYADEAGNVFSGKYDDLKNLPDLSVYSKTDTTLTEEEVDAMVENNGYLKSSPTMLQKSDIQDLIHEYILTNRDYFQSRTWNVFFPNSAFGLYFKSKKTLCQIDIDLPVKGTVTVTGSAVIKTNALSASNKNNIVSVSIDTIKDYVGENSSDISSFVDLEEKFVIFKQVFEDVEPGTHSFYFNFNWLSSSDSDNVTILIHEPYLEAHFDPGMPSE